MIAAVLIHAALTLRVTCVSASPADGRAAYGMSDGSVRVVDVATGHVEQVLTAPGGSVARLAWSPDGALLAAGLFPVPRALLDGESAPSSGWSTIPTNGTWIVWEVASGRGLASVEDTACEHGEPGLAWSTHGFLAAWGPGSDVDVMRFESGALVDHTRLCGADRVSVACWSVDGMRIFTGSPRGALTTWDVGSRRVIARGETSLRHVRALAVAAHGDVLLAGSDDARLGGWCTDELAPRWSRRAAVDYLLSADDTVASLSVHAGGARAAAAISTWVGTEVFDVGDGEPVWAESYDSGDNSRFGARYSPDGSHIVTWGTCGNASNAVRDPRTGRDVQLLLAPPMPGENGLAWTSDGRFLVVVEEWGRHASVFDADGNALLRRDRFEEY